MMERDLIKVLNGLRKDNETYHKEVLKKLGELDKNQAVMNNELKHTVKDVSVNSKDISKMKIAIENVRNIKSGLNPTLLIFTAFNTVSTILLAARELVRQFVGV